MGRTTLKFSIKSRWSCRRLFCCAKYKKVKREAIVPEDESSETSEAVMELPLPKLDDRMLSDIGFGCESLEERNDLLHNEHLPLPPLVAWGEPPHFTEADGSIDCNSAL